MAEFRLTREVASTADEVWRRVTDWRSHAAQVPLTRLASVTSGETAVGTVFVVRSGVGPVGFDDPMEVVRWEPPARDRPGRCRLEKRGRVITGWAEIEVSPRGTGAVVVWAEDLRLRPLPRALDPLVARVGRGVFGRALDGLLRDGAGAAGTAGTAEARGTGDTGDTPSR
ncbi:SRPBCC family protein [Streptomyces sp. NPDC020965]|uniref:SRPBCC family protein n=1 Tax=Streptomyces sp. NPDC020965 TaxID=3365105 RepID=UPI0037B1474A